MRDVGPFAGVMELEKTMAKTVFSNAIYAAALGIAAIAGGTISVASPAYAASDPVSITSDIMVEQSVTDASGKVTTVLTDPGKLAITPGEKLLISVHVANNSGGPITGLTATNPISDAVSFVSANEDWAEFSVDGGKSFGKLGDLKVPSTGADGVTPSTRTALPEDVTTIRWTFKDAIPTGTTRHVSFRGVVK